MEFIKKTSENKCTCLNPSFGIIFAKLYLLLQNLHEVDTKQWRVYFSIFLIVMATIIKQPLFDWPHFHENSLEFNLERRSFINVS